MAYKIIFFGTSDFSIPSLQALLKDNRFQIIATVTQPDKPVGRHQEITPPQVKVLAEKYKIPVLQFTSLKTPDVLQQLSNLNADVYVVVSYGKIIPQNILDLPKFGALNVHGSLLPRWRGASCVQAAIATGDKQTGVTVMKLDADMDHGPILAQEKIVIQDQDTGGSLHDKLAGLGGQILPDVLNNYLENKLELKEQDHPSAEYCKILTRDDGKINWDKSALEIQNLIRAYNPWPGTWTMWNKERLKIFKTQPSSQKIENVEPGQLTRLSDKLLVSCGDKNFLEILELQPQGKRRMQAEEFIQGHLK